MRRRCGAPQLHRPTASGPQCVRSPRTVRAFGAAVKLRLQQTPALNKAVCTLRKAWLPSIIRRDMQSLPGRISRGPLGHRSLHRQGALSLYPQAHPPLKSPRRCEHSRRRLHLAPMWLVPKETQEAKGPGTCALRSAPGAHTRPLHTQGCASETERTQGGTSPALIPSLA